MAITVTARERAILQDVIANDHLPMWAYHYFKYDNQYAVDRLEAKGLLIRSDGRYTCSDKAMSIFRRPPLGKRTRDILKLLADGGMLALRSGYGIVKSDNGSTRVGIKAAKLLMQTAYVEEWPGGLYTISAAGRAALDAAEGRR